MIVDIPDTSTGEVSRRLVDLRKEGGAIALGRVLTLLVSLPAGSSMVEDAITAAKHAGNEHPCRVIVLQPQPDEPGADLRGRGVLEPDFHGRLQVRPSRASISCALSGPQVPGR